MSILRFPFPSAYPGEPAPEFARLRETEPVVRVLLPTGDTAWLVTGYEDNRTVLSDPRFSRAATTVPGAPRLQPIPPDPTALFSMDPPAHTRVRRLASRGFTPGRVAALRPTTERETDQLIDELLETGPPADLVAGFARRLPIAVICELLGAPAADRTQIAGWVDVLLSLTAFAPAEIRAARMALKQYIAQLVATKRRSPGDDLISELIKVRDEQNDRLSEDELIMLGCTVLTGGFLTTASQIALSWLCLLRHPAELARLRREPDLLDGVVTELLRYNALTTGGGLIRIALEDVRLSTATIAAGEAVLPAIAAANRDPRVFADPDRFDPARTDNRHLTFGLGVHYCLGAQLAKMELEVAVNAIARRMPGLRPATDVTLLGVQSGHLVRGLPELPVSW
ncbi:cytochrome P450 [Kibdelosporangium banguiense]|uniref:Cytochrome P450 n=1 Tax=Kibdelosporangium banguiense TaxID=1365924 RepID=A0ABS4TH08_9PSEU|nr:cytochrome P450 [Kibdelosporangium banguiense]MBP2323138.1 cytochrome P450 [Kibdelosporangium banguiense]